MVTGLPHIHLIGPVTTDTGRADDLHRVPRVIRGEAVIDEPGRYLGELVGHELLVIVGDSAVEPSENVYGADVHPVGRPLRRGDRPLPHRCSVPVDRELVAPGADRERLAQQSTSGAMRTRAVEMSSRTRDHSTSSRTSAVETTAPSRSMICAVCVEQPAATATPRVVVPGPEPAAPASIGLRQIWRFRDSK